MAIKRGGPTVPIFFLILVFCCVTLRAQSSREAGILFYRGQQLEEVKGELREAIKVYEQVLEQFPGERAFGARALLHIGICYKKIGDQQALQVFQRVIEEFSDQQEIAAEAQTRLQILVEPAPLIANEGLVTRQIWADSQTDPSGSISPDGRYLSFVDWGKGDLLMRDLTTGINRYLVKNPPGCLDFAIHAVWSPDGKEIAYFWCTTSFCDLRVVGIDGSEPRTIFADDDVKWILPGGWSPDGRFISALLEYHSKPDQNIALIPVEKGDVHILKNADMRRSGMGPFTQDGRCIVYDRSQSGDSVERDIFLLAIDGSGEIPLVESPSDDRFLCLSPGGQWLFFLSDRSGGLDGWMIEIENGRPKGAPQLLKPGLGDVLPLGVSKEGVFYYCLGSRNWNPYVMDFDLQAFKLDSEPERINQRFVGSGMAVDWSPDGKYLAYLSIRRSGSKQSSFPVLVIHSLEAGEERDLNLEGSLAIPARYLRWFPDSRSFLLMASDWNGNNGFFRIDRQTAGVTPLMLSKPGERFGWPMLSPEGNILYYQIITREDGKTRIMRKDLDSGQERVLFQSLRPDSNTAPAISPDGQNIVFQVVERNTSPFMDILRMIPTEGGEAIELMREQVTKGTGINSKMGFVWTPDSSHILFTRGELDANKNDLLILPATGGTPRQVEKDMIGILDLRMHPDGTKIGFIGGRYIDEIWMLENFFPKNK